MRKKLALLSKSDLIDLADFSHNIGRVQSLPAAEAVLLSIFSMIPLQSLVCLVARWNPRQGLLAVGKILSIRYPSEWLQLYERNRFDRIDPVLRCHFDRYRPQIWSRTFGAVRSEGEKGFIRASAEHGLVEGVTGGMPFSSGDASLFSFSGAELGGVNRHQVMVENLVSVLHHFMWQWLGKESTATDSPDGVSLTAREREVLFWIASGKTTWEAARIIQITERTASFHLSNAMRKLNVRNRAHAVAQALSLGFLRGPFL